MNSKTKEFIINFIIKKNKINKLNQSDPEMPEIKSDLLEDLKEADEEDDSDWIRQQIEPSKTLLCSSNCLYTRVCF